jgi:EpsI family protein
MVLLKFLNSGPARLATLLLLVQAAILYSSIRPEAVPAVQPLAQITRNLGPWQFQQDLAVDAETLEVLKADDTLDRFYVNPVANVGVNLFIAAFRSQRNGKTPHSPKNCLPGNGWTPLRQDELAIDVGKSAPIPVNRYVVAHGDSQSLVLYWYQSRDRAVASEYKAKFWVIADAIRLNRTDTALVRVTVPIIDRDEEQATRTAVDFVKTFYSAVRTNLPA